MNDNFTIKGHVVITDDSGKTLVDTHNMIVNDGRTFIKNIIASKLWSPSNFTGTITNIAFINSNKPAAKGDTYSNSGIIHLIESKYLTDPNVVSIDISDNFSIVFKISNLKLNTHLDDTSSSIYEKINSIGLVGTDSTLLTRASFDDIIMTQA